MSLRAISKRIMACRKCPGLNEPQRTEAAPPYGNDHSPVMLLGQCNHSYNQETPKRQIPFLNSSDKRHAGHILFPAIQATGRSYRDFLTYNVCACHPLRNRSLTPAEIRNCRPHLKKVIAHVKPKLIVALGNVAGEAVNIPTKYRISRSSIRFRGRNVEYYGTLVPHPAYLLRLQDTDGDKADVLIRQFNDYIRWIVKEFYEPDIPF